MPQKKDKCDITFLLEELRLLQENENIVLKSKISGKDVLRPKR